MNLCTAPAFEARLDAQQRYESASPESYGFIEGSYAPYNRIDQCQIETPYGYLQGTEVFMADSITASLRQADGDPIVALDIGGGMGTTMLRLAGHFRQEIADSQLAVVVTNLASSPTAYLDGLVKASYYRLYNELSKDVHFVSTTFSDLPEQDVVLPNGQPLALKGNVALAHERLSLTSWSKVPERDVVQSIGGILKSDCKYMVHGDDTRYPQSAYDEAKDDFIDSYETERLLGIKLAHTTLEAMGLSKQEATSDTLRHQDERDYIIFTGNTK